MSFTRRDFIKALTPMTAFFSYFGLSKAAEPIVKPVPNDWQIYIKDSGMIVAETFSGRVIIEEFDSNVVVEHYIKNGKSLYRNLILQNNVNVNYQNSSINISFGKG